jgi:hypothetical protein
MSTNQSSLVKKLSASAEGVCSEGAAHELKKIQAALRGDFAAVSFLLLKELEELRRRFSAVNEELAEAEEEVAGRREADEKNKDLYKKTRKELAIFKVLHTTNVETYREIFGDNQELKKECVDEYEAKEELCQELGYKTIELEEAQRTIKALEEIIASLNGK